MSSETNKQRSRTYTRSIARRINTSVWLHKLFTYIVLDVMIAAAALGAFFLRSLRYAEGAPSENLLFLDYANIREVNIEGRKLDDWDLVIVYKDGEKRIAPCAGYVFTLSPVLAAALFVEALDLFFSLFHTGRYRRKLRPLEQLARQAETISSIPLDTTRFSQLEEALSSPDALGGGIPVDTGDPELRRIEEAINSLLKRMEDSYRQQGRFVSDASHELRTPIAVIQGYADLLARWGKDDPEILEESITSIQKESRHMKELVEQLLFLARGDSGRNPVNKENVDLPALLSEVWEESLMIDDKHEYVLEGVKTDEDGSAPAVPANPGAGESSPGAVTVFADRAMLKQCMRIFLENAAKYSPEGSRIRLSLINGERAGFGIEDEGSGMDSESLKHIFERFYRSDKARNSETGGTGLGLSIAKWIVDVHKGTIDVVSVPDVGSRFSVTFPLSEEPGTPLPGKSA